MNPVVDVKSQTTYSKKYLDVDNNYPVFVEPIYDFCLQKILSFDARTSEMIFGLLEMAIVFAIELRNLSTEPTISKIYVLEIVWIGLHLN